MTDRPRPPISLNAASGTVRKRSVLIAGHSTSVSLEAAFWDVLKRMAESRRCSVNALIEAVDGTRTGNLSSALRVFVLAAALEGAGRGAEGGAEGG